MKWPTDDDDSCTGQQSEQGEEHHLVAVYEAVQGVAPLHVNNWSSSCKKRAVDETKGCQNLFKVLRTYNMLKKNIRYGAEGCDVVTQRGRGGTKHEQNNLNSTNNFRLRRLGLYWK